MSNISDLAVMDRRISALESAIVFMADVIGNELPSTQGSLSSIHDGVSDLHKQLDDEKAQYVMSCCLSSNNAILVKKQDLHYLLNKSDILKKLSEDPNCEAVSKVDGTIFTKKYRVNVTNCLASFLPADVGTRIRSNLIVSIDSHSVGLTLEEVVKIKGVLMHYCTQDFNYIQLDREKFFKYLRHLAKVHLPSDMDDVIPSEALVPPKDVINKLIAIGKRLVSLDGKAQPGYKVITEESLLKHQVYVVRDNPRDTPNIITVHNVLGNDKSSINYSRKLRDVDNIMINVNGSYLHNENIEALNHFKELNIKDYVFFVEMIEIAGKYLDYLDSCGKEGFELSECSDHIGLRMVWI